MDDKFYFDVLHRLVNIRRNENDVKWMLQREGLEKHLVELDARNNNITLVWDDGTNYLYLGVSIGKVIHIYYVNKDEKWEGVSILDDERLIDRLRKGLHFVKEEKVAA